MKRKMTPSQWGELIQLPEWTHSWAEPIFDDSEDATLGTLLAIRQAELDECYEELARITDDGGWRVKGLESARLSKQTEIEALEEWIEAIEDAIKVRDDIAKTFCPLPVDGVMCFPYKRM